MMPSTTLGGMKLPNNMLASMNRVVLTGLPIDMDFFSGSRFDQGGQKSSRACITLFIAV